jgi:hypothetical protein
MQQSQTQSCTDLTKHTGTTIAAEQLATLSTPTTENLTAIIATRKIAISIESITGHAYKYTQNFMGRHSEGRCRGTPDVAVTNCTVEP